MRSIVKFALRHGIRITTILIMIILLSLYGLFHMPIRLLPEITYPKIHITYFYKAMDPEFIACRFTPYIEGFIWSLNGVKSIRSTTTDHSLDIKVTLKHHSNPERFVIKTFDVLKDAKLPSFFIGPFISKTQASKQYDMEFYVENCEKPLSDSIFMHLKAVRGVKKVETIGERQNTILLRPNLFALYDLNFHSSDMVKYLGSYFKRNVFPLNNENLLEIAVNSPKLSGIQVKGVPLRDIFTVENYLQKKIFLTDGKTSILFRIYFKRKENKIYISKKVQEILRKIKNSSGKKITVTFDIGEEIKKAYLRLFLSFSFGLFSLLLILLMFERDVSESILTLLTSLLSASVTLAMFFITKVDINVVTLSGLIFGLGLLVDTAIVFIEEYYSNVQRMNKIRALFTTSNTTFSPLLTSTLTSLVVFIPFLYTSFDIRFQYKEFIFALGMALLSSIAIVYLILPPFFFTRKQRKRKKHILDNALAIYKTLTEYFVKKPLIPIIVYIITIGFSSFVYKTLKKRHIFTLEKGNLNSIIINIYPVAGSINPWILNKNIITPLNAEVNRFKNKLSNKYSIHTFVNITSEGAEIEIEANKKAGIDGVLKELRVHLEKLLSNFGGVNIIMHGGALEDFIIYHGNVKPFMLTLPIYGYNYKNLLYIAKKTASELKKSEYFPITEANFYYGHNISAYSLNVNLTEKHFFMKLKDISKEMPINAYKGNNFIIKGKPIADFYELKSRMININKKEIKKTIMRKDRYFKILVGFAYQGPPDSLKTLLKDFKKKHPLPQGFYYDIHSSLNKNKYIKNFVIAMGLIIILIVLLITAMFNQIKASISVFFTIPFTLSGIFLIFKISNSTFDINAVLATLITIGIAVNDSIFLVKKALFTGNVSEASISRARSILYTSLTTIVTALPFLLLYHPSEMWHKFAYSIIGGITFSTFYALFILPTFIKILKITQN